MAYDPNIPQPTDRLNDSQADILGNFQALEPNAAGFSLFELLGGDQTTTATQFALYNKTSSLTGNPELFIRRPSSGDRIEMTYAAISNVGATILPSGIYLRWGNRASLANGNNTLNINAANGIAAPLPSNIPTMIQMFQVFITPFDTFGNIFGFVLRNTTNPNSIIVTCSGAVATSQLIYFAIGRPAGL